MTENEVCRSRSQALEAATREFVEHGFAGARVDAIARRAGLNKATLYYQIGDKRALYAAVLDCLLGRLADRVERAVAQADGPEAQLRAYALAFGDPELLPTVAPVMLREVAAGGRDLPTEALKQMGRIVGTVVRVVANGVEQGLFRPASPHLVHMMVVGTLSFYTSGAPIRDRVAAEGLEAFAPESMPSPDAGAAQLAELLVDALKITRA